MCTVPDSAEHYFVTFCDDILSGEFDIWKRRPEQRDVLLESLSAGRSIRYNRVVIEEVFCDQFIYNSQIVVPDCI